MLWRTIVVASLIHAVSAVAAEDPKQTLLPLTYNLLKGTVHFEAYLNLAGDLMGRSKQMDELKSALDAATLKQRPTNLKLVTDTELRMSTHTITWDNGQYRLDDVVMVFNPKLTLLENYKSMQMAYVKKHKVAWMASWLPQAEADSGPMGVLGLMLTLTGLEAGSGELINFGSGLMQTKTAEKISGPSDVPRIREEIPLSACATKDGKTFETSFYNVVTKKIHYEELAPNGVDGFKLTLRDETARDVRGSVSRVHYVKAVNNSFEMDRIEDGNGKPRKFWFMDWLANKIVRSYQICLNDKTRLKAQEVTAQIRRDIGSGKIALVDGNDDELSSPTDTAQ